MKTHLLKKQIVFISITIAMFFSSAVHAQIVYTDVIPDHLSSCYSACNVGTPCSETFNIDLNQDGQVDFILTTKSGPGITHPITVPCNASVTVTTLGGNEISCSNTNQPLAMDSGSEIFGGTWVGFGVYGGILRSVLGGVFGGLWSVSADRYLAVRLVVGPNFYYGWIRLSVSVTGGGSDQAQCTVKDFAYNSIPNQAILAAQTCPPQAAITANDSTTFCAGDSVLLSSANTGTNLSYKWKLNGTNISGATNKSYTAKTSGNYKVKVTDNTNGCDATSAIVKVKVSCKSSNDLSSKGAEALISYPNPFSHSTLITFNLATDENVSMKLFDVEGRLIITLANETMRAGTHQLQWNAIDESGNTVSNGIYLLRLETAGHVKTIRLNVIK